MREKPIEALQEQRDRLVQQLYEIYRGAPSTNYKAYKKAQEALQKLEDMTFSDAEIDKFLPKEVRRGRATPAV
jgi:vacuolar-type H+-ATPase subunit D/Vma8